MSKKKTHSKFIEEVFEKYEDEYSVLGTYINSRTKILIKHNLCGHEWNSNPRDILRDYGCPKCGNNVNRKTTEQFKQEVFELVGDEFVVLGEYVNNKTKISMKHNNCGEVIDILPNSFLNGNRCRICSNNKNKQKTTEEYKLEIHNMTNGEFELASKYTKSYENVKIKHLKCGYINTIKPEEFKNKQNCPVCGNCGKYTEEIYNLKFKNMYEDKYELLSEFKGINNFIKLKHVKCEAEYKYKAKYIIDHKIECAKCNKEALKLKNLKSFIDKLGIISNSSVKLISEYEGNNKKAKFVNLNCNHQFEKTPNEVLNDTTCPVCRNNEQFAKRISKITNGEYQTLSAYTKSSDIIKFKHNDCNNEFEMRANNFISGQRCPECGYRAKALTQEEFENRIAIQGSNEYIVLSKYININTHVRLKHLICNHEYMVKPEKFYEGNRCPICNESKGEQKIRHWLEDKKTEFIAQKEFDGLFGTGGGLLSYDFYLPNQNMLIEYQGEQHDHYIEWCHKDESDFAKQLEHDRRKNEYAINNGIKLLEIWYYDFDNIETILENEIFNGAYLK